MPAAPSSVVKPRPVPTPSSAFSAFMRGIERRAYVLALAQCGQAEVAKTALSQAVRAFHTVSASTPLSAWPSSFWSLLLAQPELAHTEELAADTAYSELRVLSSGPRAALLLRLVAGLDFAHAAQVLGVSEVAFRYASQRALQRLGEAGVSYADLAAVRERLHRQIKTLPEAEGAGLLKLREQALSELPPETEVDETPAPPRRWPLWLGLAALATAFAWTFVPLSTPPGAPASRQALPLETRPSPPAASAADSVSHPDFEQLAAPELAELAQSVALLSWLSATPEAWPDPAPAAEDSASETDSTLAPEIRPALPASPKAPAVLQPLAAAWAGLDQPTRQRLSQNALVWQQLDTADKAALQKRLRAWDQRPATERAALRSAWAAWQRLSATEQALLRASHARFLALDAAGQAQLRATFAALPIEQVQDWWLGPLIAADFTALRPLFSFVPEAERAGLLTLVSQLPEEARAELAAVASKMPAEARDDLRRQLLALPAEQRSEFIHNLMTQPLLPEAQP